MLNRPEDAGRRSHQRPGNNLCQMPGVATKVGVPKVSQGGDIRQKIRLDLRDIQATPIVLTFTLPEENSRTPGAQSLSR